LSSVHPELRRFLRFLANQALAQRPVGIQTLVYRPRAFYQRSVSPAGSRLPVVRYDWLGCGTWLRNAQTCICELITIVNRSELET